MFRGIVPSFIRLGAFRSYLRVLIFFLLIWWPGSLTFWRSCSPNGTQVPTQYSHLSFSNNIRKCIGMLRMCYKKQFLFISWSLETNLEKLFVVASGYLLTISFNHTHQLILLHKTSSEVVLSTTLYTCITYVCLSICTFTLFVLQDSVTHPVLALPLLFFDSYIRYSLS